MERGEPATAKRELAMLKKAEESVLAQATALQIAVEMRDWSEAKKIGKKLDALDSQSRVGQWAKLVALREVKGRSGEEQTKALEEVTTGLKALLAGNQFR